ncbi:hypothetical protein BDY21DRAFT_372834 [Lineolata rhizophorae]|uniref:RING-type E3 ubiquitin transferase n=1 Tax=Lineolata rhizophorae TaxID=578093 RepID=A0A6A6NXI4_9PEZI|nr:hypothetical protein BDY21DRAFT_372834 [Lineolata rhizophorae]
MDRPGPREMVFCHQCENEWYRDEHGLMCPECQSEFTEIIEPDNDPRDLHDDENNHEFPESLLREHILGDLGQHDHDHHHPHDQHPFSPSPPPHLHHLHDVPDPEEDDLNRFTIRRTGPGNFTLSGTFVRSIPPRARSPGGSAHDMPPGMAGIANNFGTMLQSILGGAPNQQRPPDMGSPPPQGGAAGDERGSPPPPDAGGGGGGNGGGGRFAYTTHRLYPRDANNPQPQMQPVDELGNLMNELIEHLNNAGGHQAHPHPHPFSPTAGVGATGPGAARAGPPPFNPLTALLSSLFNPASAAHGDAVYTQEALDRVISQLMEQNTTGSAPGPASAEAMARLPTKPVDASMLGDNGKAECSICMDEVGLGEQVTELPCRHWFHGSCIKAWLGEHDTCPHCRQGIEDPAKKEGGGAGSGNTPGGAGGAGASGSSANPGPGLGPAGFGGSPSAPHTPSMPGAFDSGGGGGGDGGNTAVHGWGSGSGSGSGSGTRASPFMMPDSPESSGSRSGQGRRPSGSRRASGGSFMQGRSNGGERVSVGERVRNFWSRR